MNIRQMIVPKEKYGTKCPYPMTPEYITIHNTDNDGSANNEIVYMTRNDEEVSFHWAVDDKEAVQGLPLDRNGWHAGDTGKGTGNRKSIGIEICYSETGGERFEKAYANSFELVAMMMKQFNIPASKIMYHQHWSGKYCPRRLLDRGVTVEKYRELAQKKYNEMYGNGNNKNKIVSVGVDGVNVGRKENYLVLYAGKASTGTNKWGTEVIIDSNGIAGKPVYGVGNMTIPAGCYVLSGHNLKADWILNNIQQGDKVSLSITTN